MSSTYIHVASQKVFFDHLKMGKYSVHHGFAGALARSLRIAGEGARAPEVN